MHRGAGKRNVVAAHALQFLVVRHRIGWKRDADFVAAGEERVDQLPARRHHLQSPGFGSQRWHGDQVVLAQVVDRLPGEITNQVRLFARRHVHRLHFFHSFLPIVPKAHFVRRLQQLGFAPGILADGDFEQLLRRVGNHFIAQLDQAARRGRLAGRRCRWNPARRAARHRPMSLAISSRFSRYWM